MLEAFEKKIRDVRLRCSINLLLEQAAMALITAGVIGALVVLTEKLIAVELINRWFVTGLAAVCIAGIVLVYLQRQPTRLNAALLIDERLGLKERFSTTLMIAGSDDPFARAAQKEARRKAQGVKVKEHFPLRFTGHWYYAAATWVLVIAMLYLPQKDLLGYISKNEEQKKEAVRKELAKSAIKEAAKPVKLAVKQLGDEGLNSELAKLDPLMNKDLPEDAKRQAIKKLGDISDKIKKLQSTAKMESVEIAKQMLKQLKGTPMGLAQKLGMELSKGNFSKAADMLRQMQKDMDKGEMSEEQKKQLSEQLKNLSEQLKKLAEQNAEFEKELEKMGLGKKLAKLNEQQLRDALKNKGLSNEQIEKLMKKASACKSACNSCSQLGQAMAAAGAGGGPGSDQLSDIMDQLNAMEAMNQQLQAMQASIDEISRAVGNLGEGMCKGGGYGEWKEGLANGQSQGTGGPGRGDGFRDTADSGNFKTLNTKVNNKDTNAGPTVASWYFKGQQVRGDAERAFSQVVQAGRENAAEAISENQIPKKYEETVKKYFGGLEENK